MAAIAFANRIYKVAAVANKVGVPTGKVQRNGGNLKALIYLVLEFNVSLLTKGANCSARGKEGCKDQCFFICVCPIFSNLIPMNSTEQEATK